MKSRGSSPHTSPQIVRRIRVDSNPAVTGSTGSPGLRKSSIRLENLPSTAMNGTSPLNLSSPNGAVLSPGPATLSPSQNSLRRTSNENLNSSTPSRDISQSKGTTSVNGSNLHSSPSFDGSSTTWSSAVGPAASTGKSGRVIERLMTENDKLKRDLNAQMIKCQELERTMQTFKPQIEALRQENDNLSHARSVDSSLITRRDRKIEELKTDLTTERARRETAEALARRRETERDDMEEQSRREVQNLTESTKHATLHAEILETSHRQLAAEYRARAQATRRDLTQLIDGREADRQKLAKLDIVTDQMRQELERNRKLNAEVAETWEKLRTETNTRIEGIEERNNRENGRTRELNDQMDSVVKEMRWLMGVKKAMRDVNESEPS